MSASDFNGFYAPSLGILHAITATGVAYCVYGAARAEAAFALFFGYMAVLWICAYLLVLNMFAELNAASKNLLTLFGAALSSICCWADIQEHQDYNSLGGEWKSLTDLRVRAGSMFYFDRQLVVNFIDVILNESANLLITY